MTESKTRLTKELPFRSTMSLDALIKHWRTVAESTSEDASSLAADIVREIDAAPELQGAIKDDQVLQKHSSTIDKLMSAIFPELLWLNEIKVCIAPWEDHMVKMTPRFEKILDAHGGQLMSEETVSGPNYLLSAYHAVLAVHYGVYVNFGQPLMLCLNDSNTGLKRYFKALGNIDLMEIKVHGEPKPMSDEIKTQIRRRSMDLEFIQEHVDATQFEFYGFWLMTLVDITADEAISNLKLKLLAHDSLYIDDQIEEMQYDVHCVFGSTDFSLGYADLDPDEDPMEFKSHFSRSKILPTFKSLEQADLMIPEFAPVMERFEPIVVSCTGSLSNKKTAKALTDAGIYSMILAPLKYNDREIGVLELTSEKPDRFTQTDLLKTSELIPLFATALERSLDEHHTRIEALIKDRFTSIHPSVEWKFHDIAEDLLHAQEQGETAIAPPIIFKDVIPLYGQADIRNSSLLRNEAIQTDMQKELQQVLGSLDAIHEAKGMPAVEEMKFRVQRQLERVMDGLRAGDEASVNDLLREDVHPMLQHFAQNTDHGKTEIANYFSTLDEELGILYEQRGAYERSVSLINNTIAATLTRENDIAQKQYPHYFEKYKTDGVEYNAYIGASICPRIPYDPVYLRNLRLWQLIVMCNISSEVHQLQDKLEVKMDVAPLILAHSTPLSIRFRLDEKKFDVDGTYNMRYEIVKKRIDKATIKGSSERLTEPGQLAIVISQEREAQEYTQYFEFLRSHHLIKGEVERLALEPMPGATGLEALRVEVDLSHENALIRDVMELVKG